MSITKTFLLHYHYQMKLTRLLNSNCLKSPKTIVLPTFQNGLGPAKLNDNFNFWNTLFIPSPWQKLSWSNVYPNLVFMAIHYLDICGKNCSCKVVCCKASWYAPSKCADLADTWFWIVSKNIWDTVKSRAVDCLIQ